MKIKIETLRKFPKLVISKADFYLPQIKHIHLVTFLKASEEISTCNRPLAIFSFFSLQVSSSTCQ